MTAGHRACGQVSKLRSKRTRFSARLASATSALLRGRGATAYPIQREQFGGDSLCTTWPRDRTQISAALLDCDLMHCCCCALRCQRTRFSVVNMDGRVPISARSVSLAIGRPGGQVPQHALIGTVPDSALYLTAKRTQFSAVLGARRRTRFSAVLGARRTRFSALHVAGGGLGAGT